MHSIRTEMAKISKFVHDSLQLNTGNEIHIFIAAACTFDCAKHTNDS